MIDVRPHRLWLGLLALALIIAAGNEPLLGLAQRTAAQKLSSLQSDNRKTEDTLRQLREDIAAAEKMKESIGVEETEKYLAPVNRLRTGQIIERRASETRLSHMTYTLSPEQKTLVDTVGAGKQELATSKLTLTADAPTDRDTYLFLDALVNTLPGRLTLRAFSLQRVGDDDKAVTDSNIHLTIAADWLSNGATKDLTEMP